MRRAPLPDYHWSRDRVRICELKGIEVVIINKGEQPCFEEELTRDVMEIMTVFCAKLYGRRSHKSKKMAEEIEQIVAEAEQNGIR